MTTAITYTDGTDTATFTNGGSMLNFPNGYPVVLNTMATVIDTNAREVGVVVVDGASSAPFSGTYTIFGGRSEYATIKALEGTVGTLTITIDAVPTAITGVALLMVSGAVTQGGVITCTLNFSKVEE